MSFIFSEQHQILNQFLQYFNEIINTKIEYKTLSDTEQDIFSHMVIKDSLLIVFNYFLWVIDVFYSYLSHLQFKLKIFVILNFLEHKELL